MRGFVGETGISYKTIANELTMKHQNETFENKSVTTDEPNNPCSSSEINSHFQVSGKEKSLSDKNIPGSCDDVIVYSESKHFCTSVLSEQKSVSSCGYVNNLQASLESLTNSKPDGEICSTESKGNTYCKEDDLLPFVTSSTQSLECMSHSQDSSSFERTQGETISPRIGPSKSLIVQKSQCTMNLTETENIAYCNHTEIPPESSDLKTSGTAVKRPDMSSVALDVESKALVDSTAEKKATIVDIERAKAESKRNRGSALRQVIAAFVANLGTINTGLVFGFSAVAIPQLKSSNSSIIIDDDQASWIASLSSVTTPVGCILSGYLMDYLGRKKTLILTEIPLIVGWLLISSSQDVGMMYSGRLLVGLGSGMVGAPARVYTCEVTQPHLRGMLSALASVGVSLGVLIEYALGSMVTWSTLAGISAMIPMLALLLILTMPETPNWLLSRGKSEDARSALHRIRGDTYDVDKELDGMMCFAAKNNVVRLKGAKETIGALLKASTLKPFGILFTYFLIYQFSGVNPVTFYAVQVFEESGTDMNKNIATVILGVVRLISTIIACISLRRCGRRPLTMLSGIGCGVTMLGLGSYMYAMEGWVAAGTKPILTWLPVVFIFIFTIACTLGFLVVPWVMIGEVYPTQVRGIAGGLTTCSAHFFIFIVVKTFPYLQKLMSNHGTFWMYGCISLLGSIFFYTCLPETKGRSLQEIEDYFSGRVKTLGEKVPSSANMPKVLDVPKGQVLP